MAISKYTAKRVKEIYGISPVIVYPVLAKNFKVIDKKEALQHLEKFNLEKPYVLLHGRMIKDKRPDMAIKAFNIAQKKLDIDLVISGTIEEEENIKGLIKNLGIEKRVHILGRVSNEELVSLYNMAKCFLMPAPKEDFGLTPIEAMACGCPVVAWKDNAGPEETIHDNKTGYLAKPYSAEDFANKILLCLNSKLNRKEISKSVKKFSEDNIKKEFLKIIRQLKF
jgi:glycosyltransferase involved in cell wall biosynthesis